MFEKATDYIDKLIKEKKLPLLDVLVKRGHEEVYRHCGSYSGDFGKDETLCMFSCTKVLTVTIAMKLIEDGKISLDAPVWDYIPAFKNAYTLDENGNKHPEKITIRHLFTMSSGLDYNISRPAIVKLSRANYENATTTDVISTLMEYPLDFTPGEKFFYSLSHDVLGAVIETVTGMNLADYAEKIIFTPLGMKNSTMRSEVYIKNPPVNHEITENGFVKERGNSYKHFHPTKNYVSGGASLISTVEELSIFADTLATGGITRDGYRIVKPETIEKMKEIQFGGFSVKNHYTCVQGADYGYGLGVRVRAVPHPSGIPVGEFGWDGAAGSYILVDTDNQISITMGLNIMAWPNVFAGEHLAIATRIYEDLL